MTLSKYFKRSNMVQNIFELHAWVKKCHFGNFSERAGMAMPCYCGPQKCIKHFKKMLFVMGANEYQERLEDKIRKCLCFMLKYSRITVCEGIKVHYVQNLEIQNTEGNYRVTKKNCA